MPYDAPVKSGFPLMKGPGLCGIVALLYGYSSTLGFEVRADLLTVYRMFSSVR